LLLARQARIDQEARARRRKDDRRAARRDGARPRCGDARAAVLARPSVILEGQALDDAAPGAGAAERRALLVTGIAIEHLVPRAALGRPRACEERLLERVRAMG